MAQIVWLMEETVMAIHHRANGFESESNLAKGFTQFAIYLLSI
jgi:hypothetical protein